MVNDKWMEELGIYGKRGIQYRDHHPDIIHVSILRL